MPKEERTTCTPRQKKMIEMMVQYPTWSQKKIASEIGVSEVSICHWLQMEYVREELDKQLHLAWEDSRREAQDKMIGLMQQGNYQATKYILDSLGYAPTQDINLNTGELEVTITGKKED